MATTPRKSTASSRKPRTAARSASRPPVSRRTVEVDDFDEPDVTDSEAQEMEAEGHYVSASLCGEELRLIPPGAWRQSWHRLLNAGQFDAFAELVLHPDDIDAYFDIDPTNNEFGEFVGAAAEQSGESLGKSRGPVESSRRTRRR
ncbi:hypothetical protein [Streptomyces sp. SAS_275]|uniref:hypothetical protein n=1 Tax=Streptomyces sp. SAS_275 TaxID=3412746 RepID=UPI00403C4406